MNTKQIRAIEAHGRQLLAIFPNAVETDPLELYRKLWRVERQGAAFALRGCNGPEWPSEEAQEKSRDRILAAADNLLNFGTVPVFVNGDPRGYALKIDDSYVREHNLQIHRDWGGYGILAPEITGRD